MGISAVSGSTSLNAAYTAQAVLKKPVIAENADAGSGKPAGGTRGAPPAGGGGKASGAGGAGGASDNSKIYDVRDTNKDGVVSAEEALQYALQHPGEETDSKATAQNYTQQGKTASASSGGASTLSLLA